MTVNHNCEGSIPSYGTNEIKMSKKILYIDMDGVVANFDATIDRYMRAGGYSTNPDMRSKLVDYICQRNPQIFSELEPIQGAVNAVKILSDYYDVYFLSTPMWDVPESFTSKRIWLELYFGELANRKLILTHRKDLAIGDFLIDDRIKHGVDKFQGEHIHFKKDEYEWDKVLAYLLGTC